MKKLRSLSARLLVLILAMCLLGTAAVPANAAGLDLDEMTDNLLLAFGLSKSDYNNYAANYAASLPVQYKANSSSKYLPLGGGTAYGNCLSDFTAGYVYQVAQKLGIDMDDSQSLPELFSSEAVNYINRRAAAIKKADLISFQIDGATFITSAKDNIINSTQINWSKYVTSAEFLNYVQSFKQQVESEYAPTYGQKDAESIASVLEYILYECVAYGNEMVSAVEKIRSNNANAVILVLGLYNPVRGLTLTADGQTIDIGAMVERMIDVCNTQLLTKTMKMDKVAFIDISDTQTVGYSNMSLENDGASDQLGTVFTDIDRQLANQEGHNSIANWIAGALEEPCEHTNTIIKNAKEATCKEEGYTGDTVCSKCGYVVKKGTAISKAAHKLGDWKQTKAPSCIKEGEKVRSCSECTYTQTSTVSKIAHTLDSGTVTKEPGCESKGTKLYKCTVSGCSYTKTESIAAKGHNFENPVITKQPDCVNEGEKTGHCTVCSKTTTEKIPAEGHKWDEGTISVQAGCESEGEMTYVCLACTATSTQTIPATGHKYENYTSNNDATCQTNGTKTGICEGCGAEDVMEDTSGKAEHTYDNGTCTICGAQAPAEPKKEGVWIVAAAVGAVVLAAAGIWFFWLRKKPCV